MPVGSGSVADWVQTTPGCALGVVANANNGYGNDDGGSGVVDTYVCSIAPVVTNYFILMESSGYVLQEDGSKIYLEA